MQILFVSANDICRGPMAVALCHRHANEMDVPHAAFDSAGIDATKQEHPYRQVSEFLHGEGLRIGKHVSKPLRPAQIRAADLILCMTRDIAERTRAAVGPGFAGKVLVLNEAVGFGSSPAAWDIPPLANGSTKTIRELYSQLKATTGRLVRMIEEGDDPEDFGAKPGVVQKNGHLDDPQFRQFVARYVVEFVERAFEPPTTKQLVEALAVLGRTLSQLEVEELVAKDLARFVRRNSDGRWERIETEKPKGKEAPGGAPPPREKAGAGGANGRSSSARVAKSKMTIQEAYELLGVKPEATFDEAQAVYRKIQMRYHPDKFHDDDEFRRLAEEKSKAVNAAWAMVKEKLEA